MRIGLWSWLAVSMTGLVTGPLLGACERPPVSPPGDDDPPTGEATVVDLSSFLQDRPAIGGKWYDYSVDGHVLEPKAEAWIVQRAGGDFHGFRIASVYDDDTGESGTFTIDVVHRLDDRLAWGATTTVTLPADVHDGPLCFDIAAVNAADSVVGCDVAHDLRFVIQSRLSLAAGFAVAEPAVFVGDGARVARFDGVELQALPDPAGVAVLDDGPADFDSTDWSFGALAPDLPESGRALGARSRLGDRRWSVVDGGFGLVEFSVADVDGAGLLRFTFTRRAIDRESFAVANDAGDPVVVDVDASGPLAGGAPVFLSFRAADLLTPTAALADTRWPTALPFAKDYDVVIVDDDRGGGSLQFLLSPASAARRIE